MMLLTRFYLYARDLIEPKYQFLIKKREDAGIKHVNNPNAFIECSNTMDDVYENINDYNPIRKRKKLIVFDDMIADIMTNKKFQAIIKELFIRCRKLNISLVFITQSYFSVPKDVRLNSTHYLIMKINNKRELQNIATNHSADIDYKYFMRRKVAKISALSSNNLDKYEYLTGEDFGLKSGTAEQLNLSIFHWVKFLIKGWIKMATKKKDF